MPTLITKAQLVVFLNFVNKTNTTVVEADIIDAIFDSSWNTVEREVGNSWDADSRTILLNGDGDNTIFVPYVPIISLSEVKVIAKDLTETVYDLAGSDRTIWCDKEVGQIEIIQHTNNSTDPEIWMTPDATKFPKGLENVSITGVFVGAPPPDAEYLQMLLYLKNLTLMDRNSYNLDLIQEKIGRYEYRVGVPTNQAEKNQYRGLDGLINWLIETLKADENVYDIG